MAALLMKVSALLWHNGGIIAEGTGYFA